MPSCCAPDCKNRAEDGVRLFRLPSAPDRARLWLEMCGCLHPKPSSRLCEKHFDSSQFEGHRQDGWKKLKPNAVPTLCGTAQAYEHDVRMQTAKLTSHIKEPKDIALDLQVSEERESCLAESRIHEHSYSQSLLKQTIYRCPLCSQLLTSLKLLIRHLTKHRGSLSESHQCSMCGKEFSHAGVLASHVRVVHQARKKVVKSRSSKASSAEADQQCLLCAVCGRQFVAVNAFHRHTRSHMPVRDRCYLCSVCGHRAATSAALHRHSAVHVSVDSRPLACAHCDRRFIRAGDLRRHVRVHSGDRPYQCSVCGRAFSRTYSLLAHGRTHAAKSFLQPCVRCRRTFRSAAALAAHRRFCSHSTVS